MRAIRVVGNGTVELNVHGRFSTTYIYVRDDDVSKFANANVVVLGSTVDDTSLKLNGSIMIQHGRSSIVDLVFSGVSSPFDITFTNS